MLGILVTGFTAEKVDVSAKTNKELQVNIKDSKYPFSVDEEVKIIVDNKLYSGVVIEVMTIMVFISIQSEEEVPDIVGKTVSYKDKTGVVIGINDFTIISDKYEEIGNSISDELQRGATILNGRGLYSGNEKNVLLVVVSKKQVVTLKKLVKRIDPNAFIIISDIFEVLGEGFKEI